MDTPPKVEKINLIVSQQEDYSLDSIQEEKYPIQIDSRIINSAAVKYGTTTYWDSKKELVGAQGTIYIYSDYQTYTDDTGNIKYIAGLKVGDGNAYLIDAPFLDTIPMQHILNTNIHITSSERSFWNNKITCKDDVKDEVLILTKEK